MWLVGKIIFTLILVGILTASMLAGIFMMYVKTTLAPTLQINPEDYTMDLSTIVYYEDKESGEWKELQAIHGTENRIWVDFDQMPDALWQAAVAIEDKRFFEHEGVDWKRTASATVNMFLSMKNTYGGSTITQQLLKNMTQENQHTVKRKVTEIFRALEFEKKYSKQEILELYLNMIYLGKGCYGVQTAAQYYFGKDVSELTTAECASLIGITNNPSMYNPLISDWTKNNNKERQEIILDKMKEYDYIETEEEYEAAKSQVLQFTDGSKSVQELVAQAEGDKNPSMAKCNNSYFVDQVIREVKKDLANEQGISEEAAATKLYHGGYNVYITMDPRIQELAESVYENRDNLNVKSSSGERLQSGITIVDNQNGDIVAMVGGVGEKTGDLVWNYATGMRQCGSSIKPITVYAPALEAGTVTMASVIDDYPVRELNGNSWPKNQPNRYRGLTTLTRGVASSINTVAVQVLEGLGIANSYEFATEKLGMYSLCADDLYTPALALGGLTYGVNTVEMASAFSAFANGGIYNKPRMYSKVTDGDGNVILDNSTDSQVAMKETTAYFVNSLLRSAVTSGTGARARISGMTVAGKTGTTSNHRDRYFVGYTPYYSAAVWCGYDSNDRVYYSGNPSIHMWQLVMKKVHEGLKNKSFPVPSSGLQTVQVCMDSGLRPTEACAADLRGSRVHSVTVATGTAPTEFCNLHVMRDYCVDGKCLATENCSPQSVKKSSFLDFTRQEFIPNVVPDDNAYLLSSLEKLTVCPVHTPGVKLNEDGTVKVNPDTGEPVIDVPIIDPDALDDPSNTDGDSDDSDGDSNDTKPDWWDELWHPEDQPDAPNHQAEDETVEPTAGSAASGEEPAA